MSDRANIQGRTILLSGKRVGHLQGGRDGAVAYIDGQYESFASLERFSHTPGREYRSWVRDAHERGAAQVAFHSTADEAFERVLRAVAARA